MEADKDKQHPFVELDIVSTNDPLSKLLFTAICDYNYRIRRISTYKEHRTYGQTIELEVRIGVIPKKSGTTPLYWNNARIFVMKYAKEIKAKMTKSRYTVETTTNAIDGATYRCIRVANQEDFWQIKKDIKLPNNNLSDEWLSVSMAVEELSRAPFEPKKSHYRYVSRQTFHIHPVKIEFSKVYNIDQDENTYITYEVEVEYSPKKVMIYTTEEERKKMALYQPDAELIKEGIMSAYQPTSDKWKMLFDKGFEVPGDLVYKQLSVSDQINLINARNASMMADIVFKIRNAMFQTPLSFSHKTLLEVNAKVNNVMAQNKEVDNENVKYIDRSLLVEAINFPPPSFAGIFGRTEKPNIYRGSTKVDGLHMLLVVCDKGTWFIYPPRYAALHSLTERHAGIQMTIIDGELVDRLENNDLIYGSDGIPKKSFWVADCFMTDGKVVNTDPHISRYEAAREWVSNQKPGVLPPDVPIFFKRQKTIGPDNFFESIDELRNITTGNLQHGEKVIWYDNGQAYTSANEQVAIDGLIFTPNNLSYSYPIEDRKPGYSLYKWKENYTIDFRVHIEKGEISLYYTTSTKGQELVFSGTLEYPFTGEVDLAGMDINSGEIVEFKYLAHSEDFKSDEKRGTFVAIRRRMDKDGPNAQAAVVSNYLNTVASNEAFDFNDLIGRSNFLMRKYHNRIIRELYLTDSRGGKKKILLDIGFGRGGPLNNLHEYGLILAIEPSAENIEEAQRRLKQERFSKINIRITQLRGEDYKEIQEFVTTNVREYLKDKKAEGKVDTIAMINSLTFFFDEKNKNLKKLAETVKRCLKPGGNFIWKAMDGTGALNKMEELGSTRITFGKDSITKVSDTKIHTKISPNVDDDEYIFNEEVMKEYLGVSGVPKFAACEALLPSPYRELSELYKYGIYTYTKDFRLPYQLTEVFGAYSLRTPMKEVENPLELITSLFTDDLFQDVISQYIRIITTIDTRKVPENGKLPYLHYETAYNGYFIKKYAALNWEFSWRDSLVKLSSDESQAEEFMFGVMSALGLVAIIVKKRKGSLIVISSNMTGDDESKYAVILIKEEKNYTLYKEDDKYIFPCDGSVVNKLDVDATEEDSTTAIYQKAGFSVPYEFVDCHRTILWRLIATSLDLDVRKHSLANYIIHNGRKNASLDDIKLLRRKDSEGLAKEIDGFIAEMSR